MQLITTLYPNQIISLNKMKSWEKDRYINLKKTFDTRMKLNIGYLCEKPGSGKTLILLNLLLTKAPKKDDYEVIHNSNIGHIESKVEIKQKKKCSIIIVTQSNYYNWMQQIYKHCNQEYIQSFYFIRTYKDIKSYEKSSNIKYIVITTQKLLSFYKMIGKKYCWDRIIYDDFHCLNIKKDVKLDTCFSWLVSATPEYTNNSYGVIKEINDELIFFTQNIDIFSQKQRKKNQKLFIESNIMINMPKIEESTMYCIYDDNINELNEKILIKLENYTKNNQIPFASYYFQHKCKNEISDDINVKKRLENKYCSICFENMSYKSSNTCCYNNFCLKCNLRNFFREGKCAICRKLINTHNIILINEMKSIPTFTEQILYNINKQTKNTIIYTSQYKKMSNLLQRQNIESSVLKNITIYNEYKQGIMPILLLHPHNFGQGYDLSNTDKIIVIENEFNKSVLKQVIGRVQRINRKKSIKVIYLKHYNF